ncbi:ribonuclease E inhibitor RraB [Mesorhizobium sp. L48C026A00]|uniref:ribonuclease E inhibitor RraB n=1 Tax=Mesorhizobium sp. L48C026A00 TaxID=1287182 RepID=UPI0004CEFE49
MRFPPSSESPDERNARQLVELEDEWGELGPKRQIDFHCTFPNFDRRKTFSGKAQDAGFQLRNSNEEHGSRCYLIASVRIEPTASTITALQAKLESFLEDADDTYGEGDPPDGPSSVDGWQYPPKTEVSFWPNESSKRAALSAQVQAAQARAAVLFGGELVKDLLLDRRFWLPPSVRDRIDQPRSSFNLVPSEFLRKALTMQPKAPEPTASAFSWLSSGCTAAYPPAPAARRWERRLRTAPLSCGWHIDSLP